MVRGASALVQSAADTFPPLLFGLALSAAVTRFLPSLPNAPYEMGGADGLPARVAVLGAALPLQLCEHTTVTAAAAIQRAGGSAGVAYAFLLSAPATNLPSLLLLLSGSSSVAGGAGGHGAKSAARVAAALTAVALVLSYVVDAAKVDLLVEREAEAGGSSMVALPPWFVQSSHWLAALLAAVAVVQAGARRLRPSSRGDKCCDEGVCKKED